jgi:hypothetical protein
MLRRLLSNRVKPFSMPTRLFSQKDADSLKKQFKKLKEVHETRLKDSVQSSAQEEIKTTDTGRKFDDLKSQFKGMTEDLKKNTGEAKSVSQRLSESMQKLKTMDIQAVKSSLADKLKRQPKPEETSSSPKSTQETLQQENQQTNFKESAEAQQKAEEPYQNQSQAEEAAADEEPNEPPKPSWSEKYPKFAPILQYGSKVKDYCHEAMLETFDSNSYKKLKMKQRLIELKKQEEERKKMEEALANMGDAEDKIPEWKKGALQVIPKKLTYWQKMKSKVSEHSFFSNLDHKKQEILQNQNIKKAKEKVDELKDDINTFKEDLQESIENSDTGIISSTKEMLSRATQGSQQSRAVKTIRETVDPEFDVYEFESDLEDMIKDLLEKLNDGDMEYIRKVVLGQALNFFNSRLDLFNSASGAMFYELLDLSKPVFLGVNIEDKTNPKFSYSFTIREISHILTVDKHLVRKKNLTPIERQELEKQLKVAQTVPGETQSTNFMITVAWHPNPDIENIGHPWQILVFSPISDQVRLQ